MLKKLKFLDGYLTYEWEATVLYNKKECQDIVYTKECYSSFIFISLFSLCILMYE
jgi:hypothetical protein